MDKTQWLQSLLTQHERALLRFTQKYVSAQLAREIVQEAYLRLWKESPYKLAEREREWLFCVCRNLALDALKKEGNMSSDALDENATASDSQSQLEQLEQQQSENLVLKLVHKLPQPQQEVIRLKFQEGFSYKEISSITGHSVSHVGVLIHEAMTKLKADIARVSAPRQGGTR